MERHGAAGRTGWALTGALIAPFVLNSAYLLATRGLIGGPWGTTDWVALGAAVAVGIAMIARLPLTVASKLVIGAVYCQRWRQAW